MFNKVCWMLMQVCTTDMQLRSCQVRSMFSKVFQMLQHVCTGDMQPRSREGLPQLRNFPVWVGVA